MNRYPQKYTEHGTENFPSMKQENSLTPTIDPENSPRRTCVLKGVPGYAIGLRERVRREVQREKMSFRIGGFGSNFKGSISK